MDPLAKFRIADELLDAESKRAGTIMKRLAFQLSQPSESVATDEAVLDASLVGQLKNAANLSGGAAVDLTKVLTSSATALVRQDLEPTLYALFLKQFPYWDRIAKKPSNGLVHAYNQISAPGSTAVSALTITELGTVQDDTSTYVRQTTPIAVLAVRRGVSLKQSFAVAQGGAPYNPEALELANGMTSLASAMQGLIFAGNADSGDSAGTATTETGLYNANAFTGLRKLIGAAGVASANNSVQVDLGNATITQAINSAVRTVADNGGNPSAVVMSFGSLLAYENELAPQVRYNDPKVEILPGVSVRQVQTVAGILPLIGVPGTTMGHYARTSDSVDVEDIYVLDEAGIALPYLGSDMFTTIEIPIGANAQLSRLFIIYGMFGMEVAAPLFNAKVRRPTP